jgi:hypothetical protein
MQRLGCPSYTPDFTFQHHCLTRCTSCIHRSWADHVKPHCCLINGSSLSSWSNLRHGIYLKQVLFAEMCADARLLKGMATIWDSAFNWSFMGDTHLKQHNVVVWCGCPDFHCLLSSSPSVCCGFTFLLRESPCGTRHTPGEPPCRLGVWGPMT